MLNQILQEQKLKFINNYETKSAIFPNVNDKQEGAF